MEYTENYHLPQWEPTDRVLREDFNDAMSDIDDALKANADSVTELANRSRFTKLREVNVTVETTPLEISVADIDWSQWDKVHVDAVIIQNSSTNLSYNDNSSQNIYGSMPYMGSITHQPRITFSVGYDSQRVITVTCGESLHVGSTNYQNLTKLLFLGGIKPGSSFTLWGEK